MRDDSLGTGELVLGLNELPELAGAGRGLDGPQRLIRCLKLKTIIQISEQNCVVAA